MAPRHRQQKTAKTDIVRAGSGTLTTPRKKSWKASGRYFWKMTNSSTSTTIMLMRGRRSRPARPPAKRLVRPQMRRSFCNLSPSRCLCTLSLPLVPPIAGSGVWTRWSTADVFLGGQNLTLPVLNRCRDSPAPRGGRRRHAGPRKSRRPIASRKSRRPIGSSSSSGCR